MPKYPDSMSDEEWAAIAAAIPPGIKSGRPRQHCARLMLDAIFYVENTGCRWRQLPHRFGPWKQVYNTYRRWQKRGVWSAAVDALQEQRQGR